MTDNKGFIEMQIVEAVRRLLAGRVNEIFSGWELLIPVVEFSKFQNKFVVSPVVSLSGCERTEKERLIKIDVYSVSITFTLQEHEDGELYCYGYAYAFEKALKENVTLGGIADRAVISGKKYIPPKKLNCGEGWGLVLTMRVTVEGMGNDG
jgi:hypothetical protein